MSKELIRICHLPKEQEIKEDIKKKLVFLTYKNEQGKLVTTRAFIIEGFKNDSEHEESVFYIETEGRRGLIRKESTFNLSLATDSFLTKTKEEADEIRDKYLLFNYRYSYKTNIPIGFILDSDIEEVLSEVYKGFLEYKNKNPNGYKLLQVNSDRPLYRDSDGYLIFVFNLFMENKLESTSSEYFYINVHEVRQYLKEENDFKEQLVKRIEEIFSYRTENYSIDYILQEKLIEKEDALPF